MGPMLWERLITHKIWIKFGLENIPDPNLSLGATKMTGDDNKSMHGPALRLPCRMREGEEGDNRPFSDG